MVRSSSVLRARGRTEVTQTFLLPQLTSWPTSMWLADRMTFLDWGACDLSTACSPPVRVISRGCNGECTLARPSSSHNYDVVTRFFATAACDSARSCLRMTMKL